MAVAAHVFPSFLSIMQTEPHAIQLGTDNVYVLLIGSTGANTLGGGSPGTINSTVEAMTTKTSIMANGSNALTEVSSTGYTSGGLLLTAADFVVANALISGTNYTTLAYNTGVISWSGVTFTAYQAIFIDMSYNSGAGQGICYWDLGGAQSVSAGTFTLSLGTAPTSSVANCLIQWTNS
jgi:hypothetical protein